MFCGSLCAFLYGGKVRSTHLPFPLRLRSLLQGPGGFNFSFEYDDRLTVNDYRRLILEESATFRAERELARRLKADKSGTAAAASHNGSSAGRQDMVTDSEAKMGGDGDEDTGMVDADTTSHTYTSGGGGGGGAQRLVPGPSRTSTTAGGSRVASALGGVRMK